VPRLQRRKINASKLRHFFPRKVRSQPGRSVRPDVDDEWAMAACADQLRDELVFIAFRVHGSEQRDRRHEKQGRQLCANRPIPASTRG
jgi:hypothetical protein